MVLICNPTSGRKGVAAVLSELRAALAERGLAHEVVYTQAPGHATELARAALTAGCRFIVAVGGDGTIHEVANGMIEDDRPVAEDAVLGVVAAGTGSDFIKTFGLPNMPSHAAAHLDGPESFPIDIGKITYCVDGVQSVRYFVNIAEAGLGARVVERARRLPRWLGPTVYMFAFWLTVARHRPYRVTVDLVDRTYEGPMNNLVVANGQFFGGGMKIAPRAAPTDGLLDILIDHASRKEGLALLPKIYRGEHVPHPAIEQAKRVKVSVTADAPLLVEADGEVLGFGPATFEVVRDALRLKV
jgi:YegS/Rv2252/BmrU family lipid kinase